MNTSQIYSQPESPLFCPEENKSEEKIIPKRETQSAEKESPKTELKCPFLQAHAKA